MVVIRKILGDPTPFLESIISSLTADGIKVDGLPIDHICYRVSTNRDYVLRRNELLFAGKIISESIVGGRMISVFHLKTPIIFKNWEINYLELPSPKEGNQYSEGYQHIEFVVDSLDLFMENHKDIVFNLKNMNRERNPDISLSYEGLGIKFHTESLKQVIEKGS